MRSYQRPPFDHRFDVDQQRAHLAAHRQRADRDRIPDRTDDNLLVATWNLTNFGLHKRRPKHLALMAEIIAPFDVVAVQGDRSAKPGRQGSADKGDSRRAPMARVFA